jgi:hypothetical protein
MTARPVAPVIPAASRGRLRDGKPGAGRPMPLASPPGRPDAVYGFGRIDASGRVASRAIIAALGWRGGDRLTLTAEAGVMVARRDPGDMVTVPERPCVCCHRHRLARVHGGPRGAFKVSPNDRLSHGVGGDVVEVARQVKGQPPGQPRGRDHRLAALRGRGEPGGGVEMAAGPA